MALKYVEIISQKNEKVREKTLMSGTSKFVFTNFLILVIKLECGKLRTISMYHQVAKLNGKKLMNYEFISKKKFVRIDSTPQLNK